MTYPGSGTAPRPTASSSAGQARRTRSAYPHRCPDTGDPIQPPDVAVVHPHAAVGHVTGDELRFVGAVDCHLAAAEPVGAEARERAEAKRERSVGAVGI